MRNLEAEESLEQIYIRAHRIQHTLVSHKEWKITE